MNETTDAKTLVYHAILTGIGLGIGATIVALLFRMIGLRLA
jgi:hypothetical protein